MSVVHARCRAQLARGIKVKEHQLPAQAHCCWNLEVLEAVRREAGAPVLLAHVHCRVCRCMPDYCKRGWWC